MMRAAVIALGLVAVSWLAILGRDAGLVAQALRDTRTISAVTLARADRHLRDATLLNADRQPTIYRAGVAVLGRRPPAALAIAGPVAHEEPKNLAAWRMVALAATGVDPSRLFEALAQIRALDPFDAR